MRKKDGNGDFDPNAGMRNCAKKTERNIAVFRRMPWMMNIMTCTPRRSIQKSI